MRYAYAYERGGELMRKLRASAYPTAVLVDPSGTVVWKGHPGKLSDSIIESALGSALTEPLWNWPKSGKKARSFAGKREYGKAVAALAKIEEPWAKQATQSMQAMAKSWVEASHAAFARGDYLAVSNDLGAYKKRLDGLEEELASMEGLANDLKKIKEASKVIKLQKKLAKLTETRINTRRDVSKLIEEVTAFMKKAEGTYAGTQAQEFIDQLKSLLR